MFTPGMTGSAWFDSTDLPRSPGGLLKADAHCRVSGWERVYVAGKQPNQIFKVKSITVLDNLEKAMLVVRTPKRAFSLPPLRLIHYAKRLYDQAYVCKYQ